MDHNTRIQSALDDLNSQKKPNIAMTVKKIRYYSYDALRSILWQKYNNLESKQFHIITALRSAERESY